MPRGLLSDAAREDLTRAIRDVEMRSRAEVVVAVRPRSDAYLHAPMLAALGVGFAVLAFMLFSPWPFRLEFILLEPALLGAASGLIVSRVPPLARALTTRSHRRRTVRTAALATFVEKGVGLTAERTGILVYVSLLERRAEVVADRGVLAAVPAAEWERGVASTQDAVSRGADGSTLARRIADLGSLLAVALPRRPDDVDELADEVAVP